MITISYKLISFSCTVFLDSLDFIIYFSIAHKYDVLLIAKCTNFYNCNKCMNHTLIEWHRFLMTDFSNLLIKFIFFFFNSKHI